MPDNALLHLRRLNPKGAIAGPITPFLISIPTIPSPADMFIYSDMISPATGYIQSIYFQCWDGLAVNDASYLTMDVTITAIGNSYVFTSSGGVSSIGTLGRSPVKYTPDKDYLPANTTKATGGRSIPPKGSLSLVLSDKPQDRYVQKGELITAFTFNTGALPGPLIWPCFLINIS